MQFLSPLFLLGVLTVALPLWVHLIRRQQARRLPFSSLMFLRRVPIKSTSRKRLTHLLLLAARCALIILIALAFARPFLPGRTFDILGSSGSRHHVILLDTSLSMQAEDRWTQALAGAQQAIDGLREGEVAQIITFSSDFRIQNLPTFDRAALQTTLNAIEATSSTTSFEQAFRAIERVQEETQRPLAVTLISDVQQSGTADLIGNLATPVVSEFEVVDVGSQNLPNWTVEDVRVRPLVFQSRYPERLLVRLRGHATASQAKEVELTLTGRSIQKKRVQIPESGVALVELDPFDVPVGVNRGEVRLLPADGLPADDVFYFTLERRNQLRLLFLREPGEENELYYFRNALAAEPDSPWFIEVRSPGQTPAYPLNQYAVVFLSNVGRISDSLASQIRAMVERGGGLIVSMGSRFPSPPLEKQFEDLWPARALNKKLLTRDAERFVQLGEFDRDHPVFRDLESSGADSLRAVQAYGYVQLEPQSNILLRFANGDPALAEKARDAGRVLLFASSFDNVWSDFPLHPVYLPFLHNLVRYAGHFPSTPSSYRIPSTIALASFLGRGQLASENFVWDVARPDGTREMALEQEQRPDYLVLSQPGFYEVTEREGKHLIASNIDPGESDLRQLAREDHDLLATEVSVATGAGVPVTAPGSEKQQSIWWSLILIAVMIAIAESLLANPFLGPRRVVVPQEGIGEGVDVRS